MRMLRVCISSWRVCSANTFLTCTLRVRISSWCICSISYVRLVHILVPDTYAQHTHQFLTVCSVHASVPNAYAEGTQNKPLKNGKTDAHAEHVSKELMSMVRMCISSWWACSACASVPKKYDQHAHKGRSMCVRNWCICSGGHQFLSRSSVHTSVPNAYAQCAHKGWSILQGSKYL